MGACLNNPEKQIKRPSWKWYLLESPNRPGHLLLPWNIGMNGQKPSLFCSVTDAWKRKKRVTATKKAPAVQPGLFL